MDPLTQDQIDHKPGNRNYEQDIVFVTKHSKWVLKSIGIWPSVLKGTARFLPNIIFGIGNCVLLFALIPCTLHIILEEKDTMIRLKLCGPMSFCTSCLLKYWTLTARKPKIEACIEHIQTDWIQVYFPKDREMMLKHGQVSRNLTILCAVFMYSGGAMYHTVAQIVTGSFIDQYNRTVRPLIYPSYSVLYDVQTSPIYEIIYILHCMCGYVMHSVAVGCCGLTALFVAHACGQIDIVVSRLNDLVDSETVEGTSILNKRFVEIIDHHLRILRFSAAVEVVLREVCLMEFVGSAFLICLLEFYCITDWEQHNAISLITYLLLLTSLTFNLFILCYIGDLLMEKTSNVGRSCFMIKWYNLPNRTIQGLILIIAMSSSPAKITAGRIVDLSLSTFANVLKTSVAYLSFLRTSI